MADRYFVAGTGLWNNTNNWSTSSGGGGGAGVPTLSDAAYFDANSPFCILDISTTVASITLDSTYTKILILSSSVTLALNTLSIGSGTTVKMGLNSKLTIKGSGTPLTGLGNLDTSTNTPNTVEYTGQAITNITCATPISSYNNLTIDPPDFSRNDALILNAGDAWISSSTRTAINGYFYVGTGSGRIVKVRASDFTITATLATGLKLLGSEFEVGGYMYFGAGSNPARLVKIDISNFTQVGLSISLGEDGTDAINGVTDGTYGYFGTNTDPGKIVRVRLSDMTVIDTLTLNAGENPQSSAIDTVNGFIYFGTWQDPGKIIKVRISDFTRFDDLTLQSGESYLDRDAQIDIVNGYAYFTTRKTLPGQVVIIRLSDFTEITPFTFDPTDNESSTIALDVPNGIGYFTANNTPGRLFKVRLSDWSRLGTITLNTGENYPWRGHTLDNGYLYLAGNASPGILVRINLGDSTPNLGTAIGQTLNVTGNLTIGDGINATTASSATYNPTIDVNRDFTLNSGTFISTNGNLGIAGNFNTTGGTFTHNDGTVIFSGTEDSAITGSPSFNNLTLGANKIHKITVGQTICVLNIFASNGTSLTRSLLRSTSDGNNWNLNLSGISALGNKVDVKDSDASFGITVLASNSLDSGNNYNWYFEIESGLVRIRQYTISSQNPGPKPFVNIFNQTLQQGSGVTVTNKGQIFVSDNSRHVIWKLNESLTPVVFAGKLNTPGFANGNSNDARFNMPKDIVCDNTDNLYVFDYGNSRIRKIDTNGRVSTVALVSDTITDMYLTISPSGNIFAIVSK